MEKNKFFVFCTAFVPGAGQMYLGMMKKGVAVMSLFVAVIFMSVFLSMGILTLFLPIIWFYSFFDTFNNAKYNTDQRLQMDYRFGEQIIKGGWLNHFGGRISEKLPKYAGIGLIILGIYTGYESIIKPLYWNFQLPQWLYYILNRIPNVIVAFAIIALGMALLKKRKTADTRDFVEYQEGKHE